MYPSSAFGVFLIFTLALSACAEIIGCPILPCKCHCLINEKGRPSDVECRRMNYEELRSIFKKSNDYKIVKFEIATSSLTEVNKDLFTNVILNTLEFKFTKIENFQIFEAFSPLGALQKLIIDNVDVKNWIFTPADDVTALILMRHFVLLDCHGDSPNDTMIIPFLPKKLESIEIRWCKLKSKEENSFSRFTKLKTLDLRNNKLSFFKRSYLPNPAEDLLEISLSYNPITSLPDDMLEGMPRLKLINLERTYLTYFSYNTFYPKLRTAFTFKITLNPLNCDCFNSWLIKEVGRWRKQMPTCYTPVDLRNRKLNTILPKEMCHPEGYEKTMEEYCFKIAANKNQNVTE